MTTNTTTPSRDEMIQTIEKVVANKELSFGCRLKGRIDMFFDVPEDFIVINVPYGDEVIISGYDPLQDDDEIQDYEVFKFHIIGHPVMIGDVMDYLDKLPNEKIIKILQETEKIFYIWQEKRKPITEQSAECVKFVYNLISE